MDGEVSFFELGVDDVERGRAFYGALFDWDFTDETAGSSIETPNVPGGLHGGDPGASPYLFFRVSDLSAALARVRELGGDTGDNPSDESPDKVAQFGRFATCTDDQGSTFGLHEPPRGPA